MSDAVTLVIQHQVKADRAPEYEVWLKDIAGQAQRYPGHMGVNILRPHGASPSYTIVLRFDSHEHLLGWIDSETRQELIAKAAPLLLAGENLEIHTGLEYWFTPPSAKPLRAKPYKQFLITLSAIYPLTLLVPWALTPLLHAEPLRRWPWTSGLAVVVVIVFLMVYVIMPRYTRLVARWLFD